MKKYQVGDLLIDKENSDVYFKIIAIAPELDYEGHQCYFVEVLDKGNKYYVSYYNTHLNEWTERHEEVDDNLEFI